LLKTYGDDLQKAAFSFNSLDSISKVELPDQQSENIIAKFMGYF